MTLILGMSKAEGVYLSADYRVTDLRTNEVLDDASIKFLTVHHPPDQGGPKSLIAYSGLAQLPDGTPIGAWIRETLRGAVEHFDDSMAHLRTRLDRDLGRFRSPLFVNVLVVHGDRRYAGGFSNMKRERPGAAYRVVSRFGYQLDELKDPFLFANGSGAAVIAREHLGILHEQLARRPRQPSDHMKLLATINRRVASRDSSVSPHCHVSYLNADDRTKPASRAFTQPGESVPFSMPILIMGVDLSPMMQRFHEWTTVVFDQSLPESERQFAAEENDLYPPRRK